MKANKTVVIIPVRGGSKRLPKKNIRPLYGIPLLAHSILYGKLFPELIDEIYISTDDDEIKQVALEFGAKIIDRPAELATDTTPTLPVLQHAVKAINDPEVTTVVLLQATNPLRSPKLLPNALDLYHNFHLTPEKFADHCDPTSSDQDAQASQTPLQSLFTVTRSFGKLGKIKNNRYIPFNYKIGQRSQDLEPLYFEDGVLYISSVTNLLENNCLLDEAAFPYINHSTSLDIDTIEEFEQADFIFARNKISYKLEEIESTNKFFEN